MAAKAIELLKTQYAAVGASSRAALTMTARALDAAIGGGVDVEQMLARTQDRLRLSERFVEAYRRYSWSVEVTAVPGRSRHRTFAQARPRGDLIRTDGDRRGLDR